MRPGWLGRVVAVALGAAGTAFGGEVDVRVENPPGTGAVVALLFDSADAFADLRDPRAALRVPSGGKEPARFEGLGAGSYAVLVFHDVNGNGELDQNFMGIPREPLGFSNRYWGKGAPTFSAAAVEVAEGGSARVEVELREIFKRKGLIGVGAEAILQSSPYAGVDSMRVLGIPTVTYIGERVQVLGPAGQVELTGWGPLRLAATARYWMGAYDEEDSEELEGMGDRKDSLFCGLALQARLPAGLRASAGYEHDALDRVGGGCGRLGVRRGWQWGRVSVAPSVGANWLTAELAEHEYGVRASEAREGRGEWRPGDAINFEAGLGVSVEVGGAWRVIASGSVEWLAEELRDSPLVEKGEVFHGFLAVNTTF